MKGVKGVKGPWELDARRCSAELDVTGDWNGVWGGTRLGSLLFLLFEVRLEEVEALAEELCVPGAVKGDGSKGRCDDDDDDDNDDVWKSFAEALLKGELDNDTLRFFDSSRLFCHCCCCRW